MNSTSPSTSTVAERIIRFCEHLQPPAGLPPHVTVMNPYQNPIAMQLASAFYQKYYNDHLPRRVLFGINPGRFGGGITGIPFTDPIRLQGVCSIPNSLQQRAELSSIFIYDMIEAFGGPDLFYSKFFFSAVSPLGYVTSNKNLNYYDISGWKELFEKYATETISQQLVFPLDTSRAYCIGQGENFAFLSYLNEKYRFFRKIITIPHPRWIMQYRLKQKEEFIHEYLKKLRA